MDEEGNQFDHYDNCIVVYNKGEKIKIPYQSNYIFWDEYDENMNVTKKTYRIIIEQKEIEKADVEKAKNYKLFKVYEAKNLIYDTTQKNLFVR